MNAQNATHAMLHLPAN